MSRRSLFALLFFLALNPSAAQAAPANSVTIKNLTAAALTDHPFSVSRFFAKGEITAYAQPTIGGALAGFWQCDRKTTWADGSLQHAVISFRASIGANASLTVDFRNSPNPSSAGDTAATLAAALTKSQMLNYDTGSGPGSWGANMELTAAGIKIVDVKTILNGWNGVDTGINGQGVRYWLAGPVATQVIIEDKTSARAYDTGFAGNNPIHPQFVATFYPAGSSAGNWPGVKVDIIGENVWVGNAAGSGMQMVDDAYSLTLKTGAPLTPVYSIPTFTHSARTRWRQRCWSGANAERTGNGTLGGTPRYVVDFNFAYMAFSGSVFNWDTSLVPPGSVYDPNNSTGYNPAGGFSEVKVWSAGDKGAGPGAVGQFDTAMGDPGGRGDDKSPFSRWNVYYLYSMSSSDANAWRMWDVMLGNGEVGAHVPIHYRENLTGRNYCSLTALCASGGLSSVDAFGKWVSIDERPYLVMFPGRETFGGVPADTLAVPPNNSTSWLYELPHQYEWNYVAYLVTGDYYLLEELQAQGQMPLAQTLPDPTCSYCHPIGVGFWAHENRGIAWGTRAVAEAAAMSPIGSAERAYFTQKLLDENDDHEGFYNITNGHANGSGTAWNFGRTVLAGFGQPSYSANPLYMQMAPDPYQELNCCAVTITAVSGSSPVSFTVDADPGAQTGDVWSINQQSSFIGAYTITRIDGTHYIAQGSSMNSLWQAGDEFTKSPHESQPWTYDFNHLMWSHASDLGFTQVDVMRKKALLNLLHQTQDSQYNRWNSDAYYFPVSGPDLKWLQTWAAAKGALLPANQTRTAFTHSENSSLEAGFQWFLYAAGTLLNGQNISDPDSSGFGTLSGDSAWAWIHANVLNQPDLPAMPKWALLPRGSAGPASPQPILSLNPSALTFSATAGGANPPSQTVTLSNSGVGSLNWTAHPIQTWLTVLPVTGGNGPSALAVSVNTAGMTAGTYNGSITFTDSSASPQGVNVTLIIAASGVPLIQAAPNALNFSGTVGGSPVSDQSLTVSNAGGGLFGTWQAATDRSWLFANPPSGGDGQRLTVSVNSAGLPSGSSTGHITITNPAAANSPLSILVTIVLSGTPGGGSTLPAPDLSGLPKTLPVNGTISLTNALAFNGLGASFQWTIAPGGTSPSPSSPAVTDGGPMDPRQSHSGMTAVGAPFRTSSPSAGLSSLGLSPGLYTITVQVFDVNGNPASTATATITLVTADFSALRVYPNPWRKDKHAGKSVTFANLPLDSTVKLFTISGRKLKELNDSSGTATWDLTNDSGDKVASGVYMYLIMDGQGNKVKGKVAVIK